MLKNVLLMLAVLAIGCSAERRDVVRYFESMQPYFTKLSEMQSRVKQISALPFEERSASYQALAREAAQVADKIAALEAPQPVAAFHQQYIHLWRDFVGFVDTLSMVVNQSLPKEQRDEAQRQMEGLQAAWPGKLQAALAEQDKLGKAYGIDFQ